jgi:hypothetical protein
MAARDGGQGWLLTELLIGCWRVQGESSVRRMLVLTELLIGCWVLIEMLICDRTVDLMLGANCWSDAGADRTADRMLVADRTADRMLVADRTADRILIGCWLLIELLIGCWVSDWTADRMLGADGMLGADWNADCWSNCWSMIELLSADPTAD